MDSFSEANGLREMDRFRAQGLAHDAGRGNVLFGHRYPGKGFPNTFEFKQNVTTIAVSTRTTRPARNICYVAEAMFRPEPISRLRLLPLVFRGAAAVFFGLSLRRRFGLIVGWLVMLACLAIAPFHDANSSVHFSAMRLGLFWSRAASPSDVIGHTYHFSSSSSRRAGCRLTTYFGGAGAHGGRAVTAMHLSETRHPLAPRANVQIQSDDSAAPMQAEAGSGVEPGGSQSCV